MILHGLFICITSFVVGVIFTWLLFSWHMDKKDSVLSRRVNDLEIDNRWIRDKCAIYEGTISEWEQLELNRLKQNAKQEKEHGNPKD